MVPAGSVRVDEAKVGVGADVLCVPRGWLHVLWTCVFKESNLQPRKWKRSAALWTCASRRSKLESRDVNANEPSWDLDYQGVDSEYDGESGRGV